MHLSEQTKVWCIGVEFGFKRKANDTKEVSEFRNTFTQGYRKGQLDKKNLYNVLNLYIQSTRYELEFEKITNGYFDFQYRRAFMFNSWDRSLLTFIGVTTKFNKEVPSLFNSINANLLKSIKDKNIENYLIALKLKLNYSKIVRDYKFGEITPHEYKILREDLKMEVSYFDD